MMSTRVIQEIPCSSITKRQCKEIRHQSYTAQTCILIRFSSKSSSFFFLFCFANSFSSRYLFRRTFSDFCVSDGDMPCEIVQLKLISRQNRRRPMLIKINHLYRPYCSVELHKSNCKQLTIVNKCQHCARPYPVVVDLSKHLLRSSERLDSTGVR